jgi:hypothetical protein
MNEMLQREGGDAPSLNQGRQFQTMDQKNITTFHIVK